MHGSEIRCLPEGPGSGEALPVWDLSDLYSSPESSALAADLAQAEARVHAFATAYEGHLAGLTAGELAGAIAEYEAIEEITGRIMSYAQLLFAADSTDAAIGRLYQTLSERVSTIGTPLVFFPIELNRMDDLVLEARLADPAMEKWRPWLRDLRVFRPHQLSDEVERLLHEKEVTGSAAWCRLFDETMAGMRISLGAEELTVSAALDKLSEPDRAVRELAAKAIGKAFGERIKLFSLILNTLAKDKHIIDTWRRYPHPESYRNCANMVEDEVVAALVAAVVDSFPRIAHRYYTLKARWLGLEKLAYWDRNAPLPGDDDRRIGWAEARECVLSAYGAFSEEMAAIGQRFFDHPWIDAALQPGKAGGAFAHPTVPSSHPYLLLNYHGRTRDVMTLAHELGHGIHQVLAAEQGYLLSSTPLTLAETASAFGEMLTFHALLDSEGDSRRRRLLLAGKVEDMINTIVRQVAFYCFEKQIHQERREGELMGQRIGEIWLSVQRESLGPAFEFEGEYAVFWSYIPHFIHTPFYVYAYAFGDCLVNALYAAFRAGDPGFAARYVDMLRAGGSRRHRELLAPFGLDAADPAFWQRGLGVIAGLVDELEAM